MSIFVDHYKTAKSVKINSCLITKVSTLATLLGAEMLVFDDGLVIRADNLSKLRTVFIDGASVAALINSQPDVHQLLFGQGTPVCL